MESSNWRRPSDDQLQRVAIARALVHRAAPQLADEPTGNLDPDTLVMDALLAQTRQHGAALVLVTHSQTATLGADRVLRLETHGIHHPHRQGEPDINGAEWRSGE